MTKKQITGRDAFTLIELLVVITIIGILAGIALPVYSTIQERGQQTKVLTQAKQIGLGLKLYASDFDGVYPRDNSTDPETGEAAGAIASSNVAFRLLVPSYVPSEEIFYVAGSSFCNASPPDEDVDGDARVAAGENHFAYVKGLKETSNPRIPLVADGMADVGGTYSETEGEDGAIWKGNKAIIVRVDQSASIENLNSDFEVVGPRADGSSGNVFDFGSWNVNTDSVAVVNPLAAGGGAP